MSPIHLATLRIAAAFAAAFALACCASPNVDSRATTVPDNAAPAAPRRATSTVPMARIVAAIEAAERGEFDAAANADLAGHPLYGWIEYAALRRDIDSLPIAEGEAFLSRHRGEPVAGAFR